MAHAGVLDIYLPPFRRLTLTLIARDFAWILSDVRNANSSGAAINTDSLSSVLALASSLQQVIDPREMHKVFGPESLIIAFTEALTGHRRSRGELVKAVDYFQGTVLCATAATLPPNPHYSHHRITLAVSASDAEAIAPLYVEFTQGFSVVATISQAQRKMEDALDMKGLWRCQVDGELAGFLVIGRFTPRTASIKNVFVHPEHRRKGVGEAMVMTVTRYYLGVGPLGLNGAPEEGPGRGVKQEICLNAVDEGAKRLYGRCGFVLCDSSGYKSSLRGIVQAADVE